MAGTVTTSTIAHTLKRTLETIVDDKTDGMESDLVLKAWCDEDDMDDAFYDDLETGGPGLASEKIEAQEMTLGTIKEGALTRYMARTFAMKMSISQEAIEDTKYSRALQGARRIKRAIYKTADYDATFMLIRAFNSSYVGGDSQPLGSASHTLPQGGTFSNVFATNMSPSVQAVSVARSAVGKMLGHDGLIQGYELDKVVFPLEQQTVWEEILGSKMRPDAGNFAAINVANQKMDIKPVPVKYWSTTTTNYGFITSAENGLKWYWRIKPEGRSWVDNDQTTVKFAARARWARGWSDARGFFGCSA